MGIPTQVLADVHAHILRCINRLQFLVIHKVSRHYWFSGPGNMEYLTFARIELHVPGSFPTLERI